MAGTNPLRTTVPWDIQNRFNPPPAAAVSGRSLVEQAPFTRIVYPPSVEKLPESTDFVAQDFNATLAAVLGQQIGGNVAPAMSTRFRLPPGFVGWLQTFTIYILNTTATTSVRFQLRVNQGPVPGWTIENSPGVANIYREDFADLRVRIPDGGVVDMLITNLAATGPWTVGGRFQGWFHPAEAERRYSGTA